MDDVVVIVGVEVQVDAVGVKVHALEPGRRRVPGQGYDRAGDGDCAVDGHCRRRRRHAQGGSGRGRCRMGCRGRARMSGRERVSGSWRRPRAGAGGGDGAIYAGGDFGNRVAVLDLDLSGDGEGGVAGDRDLVAGGGEPDGAVRRRMDDVGVIVGVEVQVDAVTVKVHALEPGRRWIPGQGYDRAGDGDCAVDGHCRRRRRHAQGGVAVAVAVWVAVAVLVNV